LVPIHNQDARLRFLQFHASKLITTRLPARRLLATLTPQRQHLWQPPPRNVERAIFQTIPDDDDDGINSISKRENITFISEPETYSLFATSYQKDALAALR
jgi:hypothetical protein